MRQSDGGAGRGRLAVVGIGPGSLADMTQRALAAIEQADVVVGYTKYVELIDALLKGKTVVSTAMMQEVDRCKLAIAKAQQGQQVAVVSSGDPGIYGMAGLVLELVEALPPAERVEVEVIPGVSAVGAAAAILGAPLMHDFAVISLSDLLTPWEVIRKRVQAAAEADFVLAIYNPKSTKRVRQIEEVREIVMACRRADTPVGIVQNACRPEQAMTLRSLEDFTRAEIDMFSLVIIGNSNTYVKNGRMITPRGYHL